MGRILVVVLGLSVVLAAAYHYVTGYRGRTAEDVEAEIQPTQQLQNVREAAGRIEDDAVRRAQELMEKTK